MTKHKILTPHKDQDGWVYVRVKRSIAGKIFSWFLQPGAFPCSGCGRKVLGIIGEPDTHGFYYRDDFPNSRTISSRRTEEAVETWDYLQLCEEEGLCAVADPYMKNAKWAVYEVNTVNKEWGATLREAYWRYKAKKATPSE